MFLFTPLASSSSGNVNLLTDGYTNIMIDCGLPWPKIKELMDFKTSSLDCILVSHSHNDHCKGIKNAQKSGIDAYVLPETKQTLGLNGHRTYELELKKTFQIGTLKIKAFSLIHDVPICGFLIMNQKKEYFAYLADTAYCKVKFPPLNILAIECNYQTEILNENVNNGNMPIIMKSRLLRSHFSLKNVIKLLKSNDLSNLHEIHLLHLSDGNSNESEMKRAIQEIVGCPVYIAQKEPHSVGSISPAPWKRGAMKLIS